MSSLPSGAENQSGRYPSAKFKLLVLVFSCTYIYFFITIGVSQDSEMLMTIKENSAKGDEVGSFIVNDADKEAYINFTIVSSDCSGSASTPKDVDG